jgi:hypothetical protein
MFQKRVDDLPLGRVYQICGEHTARALPRVSAKLVVDGNDGSVAVVGLGNICTRWIQLMEA